jgi:hypothetical protein
MEANEAHELQEHAEHGAHEASLRPVAFTMSVLAVLVAITTVLGHRTHTEAVLNQNKATDQWNEYQAKKIRSYSTALTADLLSVITLAEKDKEEKIEKSPPPGEMERRLKRSRKQRLSRKVKKRQRGTAFPALLEIGLVITSVTLLTRSRIYWYLDGFATGGILSALSVALLR